MPLPARQQQGGGPACAACKHQRRRCAAECPLARYFPHDRPRLFRNVHRLFGVSNIVKTLSRVGPDRDDAMRAIYFEAGAWDTYPAHGCLAVIAALLHQIDREEDQLRHLNAQIQHYRRLWLSTPTPPPADLPAPLLSESSNMYFDEHCLSSSLYNSNNDDVAASLLWTMQPQPPQYDGNHAVVDMAGVAQEQDWHHLLFSHTRTGGQCSVQHEYDEIAPFLEDIDDMPPFESSSAYSSEKAVKSSAMEGATAATLKSSDARWRRTERVATLKTMKQGHLHRRLECSLKKD